MATDKSERNADAKPASSSRREFFQKAAYIAPVLLTLPASPSFARSGSDRDGGGHGDKPKRWQRWHRWWYYYFGH
jgi:hypothetical protein